MAGRWDSAREISARDELTRLYVQENKSIREIADILGIGQSTVFKRLGRLNIRPTPHLKRGYRNINLNLRLPTERSAKLAEFFGIMLGDGHITRAQVIVTLGSKELAYVEYVTDLMRELFATVPSIQIRKDGYRDVRISSVRLAAWLRKGGLVTNKVSAQVACPAWIFGKSSFMSSFLRGFFDTDGSIYKLRFGRQVSLTNKSLPLLESLRRMLIELEYRPSEISAFRVYLTRKNDVDRFFREIRPANNKHVSRFNFISSVGTQAVNEGRL